MLQGIIIVEKLITSSFAIYTCMKQANPGAFECFDPLLYDKDKKVTMNNVSVILQDE